ncbi:MAG: hypothetical protein KatS3mg017_0979 [Fimbriimonadales bacterium]|nr:MAG: hypothetical protein KatS3mg017_0979 [Fimbriimonadales bacterium]
MKASVLQRTIFAVWFPLALSFTLMMLESPTTNAVLARFSDPSIQIAGFGVALGLSLLIESPVIMLLATAIALVQGRESFYAVLRFVWTLMVSLTLLTALIAFTPLYDWIALHLLGLPERVAQAGRTAMQVMLLWTAAIGWRRFLQGVLVRYGGARFVSWGTAIRLASIATVGVGLLLWNGLPGAVVGACMVMAGVIVEALVATLFALPILRERVLTHTEEGARLTQRAIWKFHLPLAGTTLLTLLVHPITAAALARLPQPELAIASWQVVFGSMLALRSWGFALQEAGVAVLQQGTPTSELLRFTHKVALGTTLALGLLAFTPIAALFTERLLALEAELATPVVFGLQGCLLLPALTAYGSYLRGALIYAKRTPAVYKGMALNLAVNAAGLAIGVLLVRALGATSVQASLLVGITAFQVAALVEAGYLLRQNQFAVINPPSPAVWERGAGS